MLISMFYASMIKASLTIPGVYKPITSLREVVKSGLEYTLFIDPVEEEVWKESHDIAFISRSSKSNVVILVTL